jgi:hypothetical protein
MRIFAEENQKSMVALLRSMALIICGFSVQSAQAEIYTCKDATGRTITSDRPIPECADRAMFVRQSPSQSPRELPRPKTADERRKAEAELEKQKVADQLEEQRKREELYLLANFKSENDIEMTRQKFLEVVNEKIRVGSEQMKAIDHLLDELQAEQRSGTTKTPAENANLQNRANQLVLSIKNSRESVARYEVEKQFINSQYDDILKRYRDIVLKRKK